MYFTREPIIESIVAPKDGYKLLVRSCNGNSKEEEFLVEALEIVSFGSSFFYRYREKPKSFLLPINEYEVVEVRETRLILKSPSVDKNIKISGGKDYPSKSQKSKVAKASAEEGKGQVQTPAEKAVPPVESKTEEAPKRERRRNRKSKRSQEDVKEEKAPPEKKTRKATTSKAVTKADSAENVDPTTSVFSHLLTPPPQLIKDSMHLYKSFENIQKEPSSSIAPETNIEAPIDAAPQKEAQSSDYVIVSPPATKDTPPESVDLVSEPPASGETLENKSDETPIEKMEVGKSSTSEIKNEEEGG